jgi:2-dehydropantoate 2-reductase
MKVAIIGAGSIGLLFASYLNKVIDDVTIYTRTKEQACEIDTNGILLQNESKQILSLVRALPVTEWKGTEDFTIITVKQYQLLSVLDQVKQFPRIPDNLLFLQNGMGHLKLLNEIKAKNIFVGTVEHGALKVNPYTVSHNGIGATKVALFRGDPSLLQHFAAQGSTDFPIEMHEDYFDILVNKLLVNAVINPLTTILQVKNGDLLENKFYYRALNNLFKEICYVLNIEQQAEHLQQIINICKKTAENRSSMLKDSEAGRLTEIDAILGFILEEADQKGKQAPQIENLYLLIKGKEMKKEEIE